LSIVYLGIGSNVDAENNVRAGLAALREKFGEVLLSPVYRSQSVGFAGKDFLNLTARIETYFQPLQLKRWLNDLEASFGRKRNVEKFSDRTLDIDILLYDDLYARLPELTVPRGEILDYAHVLRPLADIAPNVVHPATGQTMAELWGLFKGDRSGLAVTELPG
jgi:2-amino-4-hydroxy-6-hydroxymethyldihydropteridine diphosphokinase